MGGTFSTLVTSDHTVWSILDSTLPYTARDSHEAYFEKTGTRRRSSSSGCSFYSVPDQLRWSSNSGMIRSVFFW
jgi:hypothetical protein